MNHTTSKPKLLILGGGYVTITATRKLHKAIQNNELNVTVISRENFHCFHGFVGEMLTGRVSVGNIASPVRRIFAPAQILMASVMKIDLEKQEVWVKRQDNESTSVLSYDHLLIAMGSADNLDIYPGLKEHGFCLKTYKECVALKNHILKQFELASLTNDPEERKALLTFVVAGGGYAGTEIAGELSDFARILTSKEYKHIRREECQVILVCKTDTIIPELKSGKGASGYGNGQPRLVEYAGKHAAKLGVIVKLDTKVTMATSNSVHLSNGEVISTKTIINALGTKAQPVIEALDIEKDERGRIILDKFMNVKRYKNVWADGDCAALPHPKGDYCPSVGIFALKAGEHFARNMKQALKGKELKPFRYVGLGQGVSIGKRTAVVELKGVPIKGLFAWIMWRILLVYYFPTWDRRIRLIADWIMWRRDIVEMSLENETSDQVKKPHLFQDGEKIITLNSEQIREHIITEGKVRLYSKGRFIKLLQKGEAISYDEMEENEEVTAYAYQEVRTIYVKKTTAQVFHKLSPNPKLSLTKGNMPYRAGFNPQLKVSMSS